MSKHEARHEDKSSSLGFRIPFVIVIVGQSHASSAGLASLSRDPSDPLQIFFRIGFEFVRAVGGGCDIDASPARYDAETGERDAAASMKHMRLEVRRHPASTSVEKQNRLRMSMGAQSSGGSNKPLIAAYLAAAIFVSVSCCLPSTLATVPVAVTFFAS